jgi:hypothetical protein
MGFGVRSKVIGVEVLVFTANAYLVNQQLAGSSRL